VAKKMHPLRIKLFNVGYYVVGLIIERERPGISSPVCTIADQIRRMDLEVF
jgi:hypothetical protein